MTSGGSQPTRAIAWFGRARIGTKPLRRRGGFQFPQRLADHFAQPAALHEAIQVRHQLRHDEEDENPRQDERHEEAEQRQPRQLVRGFPVEMWFLASYRREANQ